MFNLVLAILSIILVAFLAFMGVYYMGGVSDEARNKSQVAQAINSAAQIDGAIKMYINDHAGQWPESLDTLVEEGYLKTIPTGDWAPESGWIISTVTVKNEDQCRMINQSLTGSTDIPDCSAINTKTMICCKQTTP